MKKLLLRWLFMTISVVVAGALTGLVLPGQFVVELTPVLFVGAVALALVNALLGGLLRLLTLPLTCLTLGFSLLIINAVVLMVAGQLGLGFRVEGFLAAFLGSILISACNAMLGSFLPDEDRKEKT